MAQAPAPEPGEDEFGEPEPLGEPEPETETPLAPTQSATPVADPPPVAATPPAPAVPITIPDGEAPPVPIAPAFPPAIPNIDFGARMKIATRLQGSAEDPEGLDDISQVADVDIYMNGQIHRLLKWQSGVTIAYTGAPGLNSATVFVQPLDILARFEPMPEFNIYMGRMIVVADRYTPSGTWGMDEFYYPGLVGIPAIPALQKSGPTGRDLGVNIWGAPMGGHLKYYLGVYQLHDPNLNPLLSGRLQVSLLSGEPAFYSRTTYYGYKDFVAIGVGGQYQADGSVLPGAMPSAMNPMGTPPMLDDYSYFTADLTMDKNIGTAGTLSLYGSYSMWSGNFQKWDSYWFASLGYMLPKTIGVGKLRFTVRYQRGMETNEMAEDASIIDAQVSYNIMPWFARFQLGYRRMEWFVPGVPAAMTANRLAAANQIYLGVVLADP